MAKKNLINKTDIYEMVSHTAQTLIALQEAKKKAEVGQMMEVGSFIDGQIEKNEQMLIELVGQLK